MSFVERTFGVSNKVALVTGGYRGLGAAIALGLAEMGAKVAITGIERELAKSFAESLRARGCDAYWSAFDVVSKMPLFAVTSSNVPLPRLRNSQHVAPRYASGVQYDLCLASMLQNTSCAGDHFT